MCDFVAERECVLHIGAKAARSGSSLVGEGLNTLMDGRADVDPTSRSDPSGMVNELDRADLQRLTRRSFMGRSAGVLAASSLTGVLIACGDDDDSGGGGDAEEVTFLTIIPLNLGFITELIGDINGHFRKEGLTLDIQSTRGSAQAIQSVLQGSALTSRVGAIETVIAIANEDAPLMNICMQWHKSPIGFASSKEDPLREPEDWRGKMMGIPSEGGTSEWTLDLMLASGGVEADEVERQVVGFSPGTFDLVEKGRIDGYVIGSVEIVRFPKEVPQAFVLDPSEYVEEGQCYVTSQRQLEENRDQLQAYMNATRAATEDVLADRDNGFKKIIELVRKDHDFPELQEDDVARGVLEQQVEAWFYAGEENLLKTVPEDWQKVYDQVVDVELAEGDKDPQAWFTNELVS
jgi:NitT/TauT family transport system substrate-binding protein